MTEDLYTLLGVLRSATAADIKAAYKRLAKRHHPDSGLGDEELFKKISHAYSVLSNPEQRSEYDRSGDGSGTGRPEEKVVADALLSSICDGFDCDRVDLLKEMRCYVRAEMAENDAALDEELDSDDLIHETIRIVLERLTNTGDSAIIEQRLEQLCAVQERKLELAKQLHASREDTLEKALRILEDYHYEVHSDDEDDEEEGGDNWLASGGTSSAFDDPMAL